MCDDELVLIFDHYNGHFRIIIDIGRIKSLMSNKKQTIVHIAKCVYDFRFLSDIDSVNVYLSVSEIQHSMAVISSHCGRDRLHHCICLRSR